jgi:hypothetical protein
VTGPRPTPDQIAQEIRAMSTTRQYLVTIRDVGNITDDPRNVHTILTSSDRIAPRERVEVVAYPERVTWTLYYLRNSDDGAPNDYETSITGPAPIAGAADPAERIPADVRAFAQYTGRANGAWHVTYTVTEAGDCTGYAETGCVARVSHGTPWHGERIERPTR